jgi:DNA-binding cell septation regulator SpoVG
VKIVDVKSVTIIPPEEGNQNPRLLATATVELNVGLIIRGVRIIDGRNQVFASLPSRRRADGTREYLVSTADREVREQIEQVIVDEYRRWRRSA